MKINRKVWSKSLFYFTLTFLFLCLLSSRRSFAQSTYLPHYSTKSGLASNNCYFIYQDKKGFLWIATSNGVSRFDGTNFQNFGIEDGLPDTQILRIAEDSQGRVWFFALNGEMSYLKDGKFYNSDNNNILKSLKTTAVVVSFLEDKTGKIWLGTNSKEIICLDSVTVRKYSANSKNFNFFNAFLHQDVSGQVYALSNGKTYLFSGSNFKLTNLKWVPLSVMSAANGENDILTFLNKGGLEAYLGTKLLSQTVIPANVLKNASGYFYYDNKSKHTWLATLNGVVAIDSSQRTVKYLRDVVVNQVLKDKAGNMWFATNQGISMLPKESSRLSILDAEDGLSSNVIKSIAKDSKHRLWLGTDDAVIDILDTKSFKIEEVGLDDFKKFRTIKQLYYDSTYNSIYFSSEFGLGVFKQIGKSLSKVSYLTEKNNSMFVIKNFSLNTQSNKLALALSSGVVNIEDCESNLNFDATGINNKKPFIKGRAYHVYYAPDRSLWYSNVNGLSQYKNGTIISHYKNDPLLTKRINDIYQLKDGTAVLATDGYGVLFYKNNKVIKQITQKKGLTNNICLKIFIKNNELWVLNSSGVNKITNFPNNPQISNFDYGKELLKDDVNDLFIDDSTAYFATNTGLILFNYTKKQNHKTGPPVFITSIKKNLERLALNEANFSFASNDNSIVFMFSAIDFSTNDIVYRYRLNQDLPYIETKNRRLDFSSLQPGDYNLEVGAKSQNSNWGLPAKVSFSIAPKFWQTWWFIGIVALLGALLFYKSAVFFTKKQKDKEQQALRVKNRILTLEQQALQAMMNPHFVFNVMNAIQHYINTQNTSSANKLLTGFARLIRKNLEICTKGTITLQEEIEYLKLYLKLEKSRFGDKLTYSFLIDEDLDTEDIIIPSMLLQPYVENAIWHGIMPKESGGHIEISMTLLKYNCLEISIVDDGVGIENSLKVKKDQHVSKGMQLTAERIKLLGEIDSKIIHLNITQNDDTGTKVVINMPLQD